MLPNTFSLVLFNLCWFDSKEGRRGEREKEREGRREGEGGERERRQVDGIYKVW